MVENRGCDYSGTSNCTSADSEIRKLPILNGYMNFLLCEKHYHRLNIEKKRDIPKWEELEIYKEE